jgi:secreted trypsin-like serine protease
MTRRGRLSVLAITTASVLALTIGSPAGAITFGTNDGGRHPNVGSLVGFVPGVGPVQWCSGTLISPTVFLTASHCFAGFDDIEFRVTFDEVLDTDADGIVDPSVNLLTGTRHMNPLYASGGANNTFDVAVFVLDQAQPMAPAALPAKGLLDTKAAQSAAYTAVGYGTIRDNKKAGPHSLGVGTRRKYVEQTVNSVVKNWVTFSMNPSTGNGGTCYGDSGGPHFLGTGASETNVVVALTVTGDRWCRSTDKDYRLDTKSARDFLGQFVTLP